MCRGIVYGCNCPVHGEAIMVSELLGLSVMIWLRGQCNAEQQLVEYSKSICDTLDVTCVRTSALASSVVFHSHTDESAPWKPCSLLSMGGKLIYRLSCTDSLPRLRVLDDCSF